MSVNDGSSSPAERIEALAARFSYDNAAQELPEPSTSRHALLGEMLSSFAKPDERLYQLRTAQYKLNVNLFVLATIEAVEHNVKDASPALVAQRCASIVVGSETSLRYKCIFEHFADRLPEIAPSIPMVVYQEGALAGVHLGEEFGVAQVSAEPPLHNPIDVMHIAVNGVLSSQLQKEQVLIDGFLGKST
jgi:hypothetical protein